MRPLNVVYLSNPDAPAVWLAIGILMREHGPAFTTTRTELAKLSGVESTKTVWAALLVLQWGGWIIVSKLGQRTRIILPAYARRCRHERRNKGDGE